ncbi:DUF4019 domain-containing protein [Alteromonas sp. PRIM-21]|uniref:DUF4019 domain-containing protein n=1 Tax=Alteromonas sp. PRIM-21 TaxID=1454978 RepID=UPI0022B948B4|nr:DUF4019 domain-containing protein [Alteromonas sp. PRIM-21]MCZ8529417.1 DUF4019 domain-containing protein [Alteromonas sp. PRIM-21]
MDMKVDSQKLIQLRNAKAWSQQYLADVSGLSLRTIQRIEKTQSASHDSIGALASVFETTPGALFMDEPDAAASHAQVQQASQTSIARENRAAHHTVPHQVYRPTMLNHKNVLWVTLALAISLFVAIYYAQTVNANNGSNQVIEAGKPVNVSSEALENATDWLRLIDSGEYEQSWQESAAIFRSNISQAKWAEALQLVRKPLGDLKNREFALAQAPSSLPGLPKGNYLILSFSTQFTESTSMNVETLSMVEVNGEYKAIGYFIK